MKNKATNLFVDEHLFEKMAYFKNTDLLDNPESIIKLPYINVETLDDQCLDNPSDIRDFYHEACETNLKLKINNLENPRVNAAVEIRSLSLKEFKAIVNANKHENISIIYPSELLTLEELEDIGVLA